MPQVEERVSRLEQVLEEFIKSVNASHMRTEAELREFKEEMRLWRERSERDLQENFKKRDDEIRLWRERSERDMQINFKKRDDEMKVFKDEMKAFKDEMKEFKDEMKVFKDEMKEFKDEMKVFKDEMKAFRDEMKEEQKKKNKEWSNLAKKMGTLVEDLIAPALRPVLKQYFDCEVTLEGQRMFRRKNGVDYEVDAIAACDDKVFMIEVRSTPRDSDIKEIKEKSERFFEFFPEFKDKRLIIIFGSITFSESVLKYASRSGIYAMGWREWEYMDILNFNDIKGVN